jgi:hypothetical protein
MLLAAAGAAMVYPQSPAPGPQPTPQNVPPPDPAALLKTVYENQKQIEATRKDYIFRRKDVEQALDSQGQVKSTEAREYEVYFVGPIPIERLVGKDGKPLSEGERRRQEEDVRRQEAKARARIAKRDAGSPPDKDELAIARFLAADRFFNLRRETNQGREVYAMDFAPRPDFQPHSLSDKVIKSLGGTIWIDEQAKQVVRLEARLIANLKVAGGLVSSVQKGSNAILENRFVNNELWMPSYTEFHLDARVFLIHRSVNTISTFSDYRKFRVGSKIRVV